MINGKTSNKNDYVYNYIENSYVYSHRKKFSFPILYNDELLKKLFYAHGNNLSNYDYFMLKYSGIFEYAYDNNSAIILGIKNIYNNKSFKELFQITMDNLKRYKEKDVEILHKNLKVSNNYYLNMNESNIIKTINSNKVEDIIYLQNCLSAVIKTFININITQEDCSKSYINKFLLSFYYNRLCGNLESENTSDLFFNYISYSHLLQSNTDNFVKFADKTCIKPIEFSNLKEKIKNELITRVGKEKFDTIIKECNGKDKDEEYKEVINNNLIEKKNIDDEIREIEKRKSNLKKNDFEYKFLDQRLKKLLFYKKYFDSKEVITDKGPVFSNYYGFQFDDIYVFDCFFDDENILRKAKKEYGNRVYLLTLEDYEKVKCLNSKTEINKYINNNLKPCAGSIYHGENYEQKLFTKIELIKKSIKVKEYILNLSKVDNPVTDEEIYLTKEEFDNYVSKYISSDEEIIKKLEKKSRLFETQRERNIRIIDEKKNEQELIKDLNVDDRAALNEDIDDTINIIEKANKEIIDKGLTPLSLENTDFIELYMAYLNYVDKHKIERKTKRDPMVAIETKRRTYYDGYFHCELCDKKDGDPLFFDSHHFIPISEGGPDDIYNTVCLCLDCHRSIHNNRVTNFQNFMLIQKIKNHIMLRAPEYLSKFEKTLSFKENRYLELIDQVDENIELIENKIEEAYDKNISDEEILSIEKESENKIKELEMKKQKLINLANKIQNYYIFDNEHVESKKDNSDVECKKEKSNKQLKLEKK